jgi:squalene-hopene/tetraprenyl-beta-curcumene cyclase
MFQPRPISGHLLFAAGLALLLPHEALGEELTWNTQGAARFLSNREHAWLEFTIKRAEKRGQSQNAACASCHTVLPSLLAEPAMERALGRQEPSPYTIIFLDRIRDKVMRPEAPQNARFGYLRSAEPIIYALALVLEDRERQKAALSKETEEAFRHMWAEQLRKGDKRGSWAWPDTSLDPWETPDSVYYGTALAALAIGNAPADYMKRPEVKEQLTEMSDYLRLNFSKQIIHHRLAALWASANLPDIVSAADRTSTLEEIWRSQNSDGGWSWRAIGPWKPRQDSFVASVAAGSDSDGYATAYAACALGQAGIQTSDPGLHRALAWLAMHQNAETGGWEAKSINGVHPDDPVLGHLMGDAASAYAVIALSKAGS